MNEPKICVIGLGYVGLPVALSFAKKFPTIGFDSDQRRIDQLRDGIDANGEFSIDTIKKSKLQLTTSIANIENQANFYIICVPTPVDDYNVPDLTYMQKACFSLSFNLKEHDTIVFESTVYPGAIKQLKKLLPDNATLRIGYSPERINPGDKVHTFENITKVVAGETEEDTEYIASVYSKVVKNVYKAQSIEVAEAAKVIENIQRDVNIALVNELALLFDKMGINTKQVLDAAATKWNFHDYRPGLVGGHCIGVDPYYLLHAAKKHGFHPQIIDAGRRVNDSIVDVIVNKVLSRCKKGDKILQCGYTFKENCSDDRNSKALEIYEKLIDAGMSIYLYDPYQKDLDVSLEQLETETTEYDCLILSVPHDKIMENIDTILDAIAVESLIVDVKSALDPKQNMEFDVWQL